MRFHLDLGPWCWTFESSSGPAVLRHEPEEEDLSQRSVDLATHHEIGFQPNRAYETTGEYDY